MIFQRRLLSEEMPAIRIQSRTNTIPGRSTAKVEVSRRGKPLSPHAKAGPCAVEG